MKERPLVAFVNGWSGWIPMQVARGVLAYAREHTDWRVRVCAAQDTYTIKSYAPAAIVALAYSEVAMRELVPAAGLWVGILGPDDSAAPVQVQPDDLRIGQAAAEHLLQKGLKQFAYYGADAPWSRARERGFSQRIEAAGYSVQSNIAMASAGGDVLWPDVERSEVMTNWLTRLKTPPIGIMVCNDGMAAVLAACCQQASLRMPEQVAIVGVDNDQVLCETAEVPLSSVDPDWERLGREAAQALYEAMRGQRPLTQMCLSVPPKGVSARESTDVLYACDDEVRGVLAFFRANVSAAITARDLEEAMGMSLRSIELKFRAALGRTPWDELRRLRMEMAAELLRTTDLKLQAIAPRCGFEYLSYFSRTFSQQYGLSPSKYRQQNRSA